MSVAISKLQSTKAEDTVNVLPIYSFGAGAMNTGSTIPAYSFEAYITDIDIHTEKCDIPQYTVRLSSEDETMGTVAGDGEYDINSTVTVSAKAKDGYEFVGWYDGDTKVSSSSQYTIRLREDMALTAKFESAADDPNLIKWTFSPYGDAPVNASGETEEFYKDAVFHMNSGDSITGDGLYWKAPGGTKSDAVTVVSNNRYIEFIPEKSGTLSITFAGSAVKGSNWPRMYISAGTDISCMTKEASEAQIEPNKSFDNKKGAGIYDTMTAELTEGVHYYIWAYYYGQSGIGFTISEIKYEMNE